MFNSQLIILSKDNVEGIQLIEWVLVTGDVAGVVNST